MERGSFFKSLATLIVAPKILVKINWTKALKHKSPTKAIFNDLQMVIPEWYPKMIEKYADSNYMTIMEAMGHGVEVEKRSFQYFDRHTGQIMTSEEPISATIIL